MIYVNVYGRKLDSSDKEKMMQLMGYIDIPPGVIKFWDLDTDEVVSTNLINYCVDGTFSELSRQLIQDKVLKPKQLLKGNIVVTDDKFILFSIPLSIKEAMATEDHKDYIWQSLSEFGKYIKELGYNFGATPEVKEEVKEEKRVIEHIDDIHDDIPWNEVPSKEPEKQEKDLGKELDNATIPKETVQPEKEHNIRIATEPVEDSVDINVDALIDAIVESFKSDATMGKSLKLTKRIVLHAADGSLINIYPSNIIKTNDPGTHMSFKDMFAIIKMALIVGSKNIKLVS